MTYVVSGLQVTSTEEEGFAMLITNMRRTLIGGLLVSGLAAVTPAAAQVPNTELPKKAKSIVMVGCFERRDNEHHKSVYVITKPSIGYATTVSDGRCASTEGDPLLELRDMKHTALDDSMLGQWIEVRGDLKKQPGGDDFRELHLIASRVVPIAAPRAAEVLPEPAPRFEPSPAAPAPEAPAAAVESPAPVATTGVAEPKRLPKTASSLPLTALIGFLSVAVAASLRALRRRDMMQRG